MHGSDGPPRLPLLRLRCSSSDRIRSLLEREPAWGHALPQAEAPLGDAALLRYRLRPQSFAIEVRFRRQGDQWLERDAQIVPGATVALRLVLGDCDPARVTRAVGLPPTRAWAKGDAEAPRSARDEGLWIHEVQPGVGSYAEEKVQELLALLRMRSGLRALVDDPQVRWAGVTLQFHGSREQMGGLALDRTLVEDLAALGLALDVQMTAD